MPGCPKHLLTLDLNGECQLCKRGSPAPPWLDAVPEDERERWAELLRQGELEEAARAARLAAPQDAPPVAESKEPKETGWLPVDSWHGDEREKQIKSWAGRLWAAGVKEPTLLRALLEINTFRCVPELPDAKIQDVAQEIAQLPRIGFIRTKEKQSAKTMLRTLLIDRKDGKTPLAENVSYQILADLAERRGWSEDTLQRARKGPQREVVIPSLPDPSNRRFRRWHSPYCTCPQCHRPQQTAASAVSA